MNVLLSWAERYFPLIKQQYDKKGKPIGSKMEQMKSVEKMSGITPKELVDMPEPDDTIMYMMDIFYSLKREVGVKLSYQEIKSYMDIMGVELDHDEVDCLIKIDNKFERGMA